MQLETTLTDNALHFSTLQISAFFNADPLYLSLKKTIHEQQTEIYDVWYCAVALLKAMITYNLQALLKCTKIIQIQIICHLRTNALIIN